MRLERIFVCLVCVSVIFGTNSLLGQQNNPTANRPGAASRGATTEADSSSTTQPQIADGQTVSNSQPAVPRLIRFSGILQSLSGKPIAGPVDVTFSLYSEEAGGAALWFETQTVQADVQGHYTVLLGAMTPTGVPMELFTEGQAHWLGVQVSNLPEQPRVLLVSVPYAMKAGDAETLAGKPASAYQLTAACSDGTADSGCDTTSSQTTGVSGATSTTGKKQTTTKSSPTPQAVTSGATNFVDTNTSQVVGVTQNGTGYAILASASGNTAIQGTTTKVGTTIVSGVYGVATAPTGPARGVTGLTNSTTGTGVFGYATAATGTTYGIAGQSNSTSGTGLRGDEVATTGATVGLMGLAKSTSGTGIVGQENATSGNTTGILARIFSASGTGLVINNLAGGKLFSGQNNGTEVASVNGIGTFTTSADIGLPETGPDGGVGVITLGGAPFMHDYCSGCSFQDNVFVGHSAGNFGTTGSEMTAVGYGALFQDTSGVGNSALGYSALASTKTGGANTSMGYGALSGNTAGNSNTAVGAAAGWSNSTGSNNTFVGDSADTADSFTVYNNATAIGYGAKVGASNALVLGNGSVNVGVGTSTPRSVLEAVVNAAGSLGPSVTITNSGGGAGAGSSVDFNTYSPSTSGTYNPSSRIEALDDNFSNDIAFLTNSEGAANNGLVNQVEITKNGQLIVDASHENTGLISGSNESGAGLIFGGAGSGEGIASCRSDVTTCTTNNAWQYGLNFYTSGSLAFAIANNHDVYTRRDLYVFGCVYYSGGSVGTCISDMRLKKNIQPFSPVLDRVVQLQPVHFNWKGSNPTGYPTGPSLQTGLIAQQVEKVFPNMVIRDENGYRRVNYGELPFLTLESIRELKQRNDILLAEVQTQSKQIAAENAEITNLKRISVAKEAEARGESKQIRKLTVEVKKLEKSQAEMAALEARLAQLETKSLKHRTVTRTAAARSQNGRKRLPVMTARALRGPVTSAEARNSE